MRQSSSARWRITLSDTTALPCATCGYDLRVTPRGGICPECATPVEKAIELAKIPIRPAWRDSDPRWRRRMVAGAWVMVFIPLIAVLHHFGFDDDIRVPFTAYVGDLPLRDSFVTMVYAELVFCIGLPLLFAKERGRRPHWLDRTKRWGAFVTFLVLVLTFANLALVTSLVIVGIGALLISLPFANQPAVTPLFTEFGPILVLYGPNSSDEAYVVFSALSALGILLACVPVSQALRRSGARVLAWVMVVPLTLTALLHLAVCVLWVVDFANAQGYDPPGFFFQPGYLTSRLSELSSGVEGRYRLLLNVVQEYLKWLPFLGIALWLTIAQVRAWRKRPTPASAAT
jgi:hypothetical protein